MSGTGEVRIAWCQSNMSHVTVRSYELFVSIIAQFLFPFTAILLHLFGRNVVCGRFLYFGFDHITLLSGRCLSVAFHSYLAAAVGGVVSGTGQIRIAWIQSHFTDILLQLLGCSDWNWSDKNCADSFVRWLIHTVVFLVVVVHLWCSFIAMLLHLLWCNEWNRWSKNCLMPIKYESWDSRSYDLFVSVIRQLFIVWKEYQVRWL